MQVRGVRVRAVVRPSSETDTSAVDLSTEDRVMRRWMSDHRVQQGDTIYAARVHVDRVNHAVPVRVVVTESGLVRCVAQPPIRRPVPDWPLFVNLATEPPQR